MNHTGKTLDAMPKESFPFISFIIPTYQAEKYLDLCLSAIFRQDYPMEKIEVMIIDGGSTDATLQIALKYPVIIMENKKRIAEYAKYIGIQVAKGDYFILLDSDNEIMEDDWLQKMVRPMIESPNEIFGVESRLSDDAGLSSINRCFARMRVADPVARFLRNKHMVIQKNNYRILAFQKNDILITGANGFLWSKSIILPMLRDTEKFEETNIGNRVFQETGRSYAIPDRASVRHYYCESFHEYYQKRFKIARKVGSRMQNKQSDTWVRKVSFSRVALATIYFLTFISPLLYAIRRSIRDKTLDWLWYPIFGFITVVIYIRFLLFETIGLYGARLLKK